MAKVPRKRSLSDQNGLDLGNTDCPVVNWTDLARDHILWRTLMCTLEAKCENHAL